MQQTNKILSNKLKLSLFLFVTMLFSAQIGKACTWTVISELDCQIQIEFLLDCSTTTSGPFLTNYGYWGTGTSNIWAINPDFCNIPPNCNVLIKLNGIIYADGMEFCCPSVPPGSCSPNGCGTISIDPVTHTVTLRRPSRCP